MMETSLSGVLQQAVLRTHLRKQQRKCPGFSSPSPTSKNSSFSSSSPPSVHLQDHELERPPYDSGDVCSGESSSSPSSSPFCDPVLQYISDILDEEDMEDRRCMMQECISYQATMKEFYEILRGKGVETSAGDFHSGEDENGFLPRDKEEGEEEGNVDDDESHNGKFTANEYEKSCNNGKDHFGLCVDERQVELELMGKKKEDEEDWMQDLLKSIGEDRYKDTDECRETCIPDSCDSSGNSHLLLPCKDDGKLQSVEEVYADRNPEGGIGKQHVTCPAISNTMAIDVPDAITESFTGISSGNGVRPFEEKQIGGYGSEHHGGSEDTIGKPSDEVPPHHGFPKVHENTIKKPFGKITPHHGFPMVCDDVCNTIGKLPQCGSLPNLQNGSGAVESFSAEIPQGGLLPNLRNGSDAVGRPLGRIPHGGFLSNLHGTSDTVEGSSGQIARGGFLPNLNNGSHTSGKPSAGTAAQSGFLPNLRNGTHASGKPSADTAAQSGLLPNASSNGGKPSISDATEKHSGQRNMKRPNEAGGQAHGHQLPRTTSSPTYKGHDFDEKRGSRKQGEIVSYVRNGNLDAETCGKVLTKGLAFLSIRLEDQGRGEGGSLPCKSAATTPDLKSLLMQAAMAADDIGRAHEILQEIRRHSSPHGDGSQRLAHYFAEGLVARLSRTGGHLYTALASNAPSAARMLKAHHLFVEVCPFVKLSHYFANKAILEAARGASSGIHVVDYGILYGLQWPCLISALAERRKAGEPLPRLRITGIDFPRPPGVKAAAAARVEMTGRRLAEYARAYDVPFEYRAIAGKWESIAASDLRLDERELLVVNTMFRLRHLLDETVLASNPRRALLGRIRGLRPALFVLGVRNGDFNSPFFVPRFREAFSYFEREFDMIDSTIAPENPERMMMEREVLGRDILNVVACEGAERVERPETYAQWQNRVRRAGFEPVPLDRCTLREARAIMKSMYDKRFSLSEDGHWMLLGWKGRPLHALSVWKPTADHR